MTISERVLAYLKEHPGKTALEIAKALNLKRRLTGYTHYWGNWSFERAEAAGLIEFRDAEGTSNERLQAKLHPGGWHLKVNQ